MCDPWEQASLRCHLSLSKHSSELIYTHTHTDIEWFQQRQCPHILHGLKLLISFVFKLLVDMSYFEPLVLWELCDMHHFTRTRYFTYVFNFSPKQLDSESDMLFLPETLKSEHTLEALRVQLSSWTPRLITALLINVHGMSIQYPRHPRKHHPSQ